MTNYRRVKTPGATYFFTVNLAERHNNRLLLDWIDNLRQSFRRVKRDHPFEIDAVVVLPDHIHCFWTLPEGDGDYQTRWSLIKAGFSRTLPMAEKRSESRVKRGERGIWQRRYWEHLIRDERDFERHVDYIHWNPVKHGRSKRVVDWPYSSFHDYVGRGVYPSEWAWGNEEAMDVGERRD